jgi:RimJ/RimL family protein N-acetyltransferase
LASKKEKKVCPMNLQTQRLTLRTITQEDWAALQRIWQDFNATPFAQFDTPHADDAAAVQAQAARWVEKTGQGREHQFYVVSLEETVIGFFALHSRGDSYELSYAFCAQAQGKGYARESLLALLDYARTQGIHRITAGTGLQNLPSVRLLKSVGFRQVGTEQVSFYQDEEGKPIYFTGGIFSQEL